MKFERDLQEISLSEFEKLTGARWINQLCLSRPIPLRRKRREALWLGAYFQKEIREGKESDVAIRWIDTTLGWGVFALRDFRKMEYIAEYAGRVRRRKWWGEGKNGYCFEYLANPFYTIDALEEGGIGRYINHSANGNLESGSAIVDEVSHIVFYTRRAIAKGEQLCYDYGPDYWADRPGPMPILRC
jgi:SET domain-containing protein